MTLNRRLTTTVALTSVALLAAMAVFGPALPAAADANGGVIDSDGPLTRIQTTADLNCSVNHSGDSASEFYGGTACGTFVAVGGTLYGPANVPAGAGASPRTAWTTGSQIGSGLGTSADPYRIVTTVTGGPLSVTQVDLYVVGAEYYSTRIDVQNNDNQSREITVYRAGDCYLQNSDLGYGKSDPASGSVACVAGIEPGSRIEQWAPITPGSRYFESGYGSVWARIGSQQPFPNTSDDGVYQDNGAGLSWTTTIPATSTASFAHLTAFSPTGAQVSDTDGDGFPDSWESPDGGVDTNGDGSPDLKLSDYGATPDKPDVFVQVGWTQTRSCALFRWFCGTTNRRPSLAALRDVQSAFQVHGVRLHIDAGPDSLMNPDTGATWGDRSHVHDGVDAPSTIPGWNNTSSSFDWTTSFDGYRDQLFGRDSDRSRIFHFALYVGRFNAAGNSGISRGAIQYAGRDFLVAYDVNALNNGHPTRIQESGTFMHELGHNLGLTHGGSMANQINWKPNYPSIMNYMWQLSGVPKHDSLAMLDYSEGDLSPIDEHALVESQGLEPDSVANDIGTNWACPGTNHLRSDATPSSRDVDWNCDHQTGSAPEGVNVNGLSDDNGGDQDLTVMTDNNDWASLIFDGGGTLGASGDAASAPATTPNDEIPATVLAANSIDHHPVTFDNAPGQLAMRSGSTSPLDVTLTNHRQVQVTYRLSTIADGVTLADVPAEVNLTAGQSKTFSIKITADGPSVNAFYEIDADGGDLSNSASSVTEVYVTEQPVTDQPAVLGALDHVTVQPSTTSVSAGTPVVYTVTGYDQAGNSRGPIADAALTITPDGTCSDLTCSATKAGVHSVTATASTGSGTVSASAALTISAGPADAVVTLSGDGQAAPAGQTFGQPLSVRVVDVWGNPVATAPVTFTISSGATFVGSGGTMTVNSASDGLAQSAAIRAGTTTGAFTVAATSGTAAPANFTLTVTESTKNKADLMVNVAAPATAKLGTTFGVTLRVTNKGPSATAKTLSSMSIPYGMTVTDAGGGTVRKGVVVFTTGTLTAGQTVSYTVHMKPLQTRSGQAAAIFGGALSATPDPVLVNNLAKAIVKVTK